MNLFGEDEDIVDEDNFEPSPAEAESVGVPTHSVDFIGYNAIEAGLVKAINENRLSHALIFTGDEGRGKETMAYRLARALLSSRKDRPFADLSVMANDPIISRLESGAHPDFKRIARVNRENKAELASEIVIKTVREATHFMQYKPVEGQWRIVIVDEAHLMNEETQNAFLKTLEEPPPDTILILIAHQPARLLPTIRSRAQVVPFHPLPDAMLIEQGGAALKMLSADTQAMILRLARGGVGAMKRLLTAPYVEAIEKIRPLLHGRASQIDIAGFSESWSTAVLDGKAPLDFLEDVLIDHVTYNLRSDLGNEAAKDAGLDTIDGLRELFHNARTRYLDKRHVIRQAFSLLSV